LSLSRILLGPRAGLSFLIARQAIRRTI